MTAFGGLLRRFTGGPQASTPPRVPLPPPLAHDRVAQRLHEAVAADLRATADNVLSYEARVRAMIEDLFAKLEERDAGHRP
jgi:hypothetical protein